MAAEKFFFFFFFPKKKKKKRRVLCGVRRGDTLSRRWRKASARGSSEPSGLGGCHKWSLTISVAVTLAALAIYGLVFLGERPLPLSKFMRRLEFDSLDVRFQFRGRMVPDPRIVIVDIDQRSQEVLGRWPFPRIYFAKLVDALREDGARVVTFDITFSSRTRQSHCKASSRTRKQHKQGKPRGAGCSARFRKRKRIRLRPAIRGAIQRFGSVVLGDYFLYTQADLEGVESETLDSYANLLSFFRFRSARAGVGERQEGRRI